MFTAKPPSTAKYSQVMIIAVTAKSYRHISFLRKEKEIWQIRR
jgi:hypothetical protein